MALIRSLAPPAEPTSGVVQTTHIRRCTFRRVTAVSRRGALPLYDVACLYPDRQVPIPLGDIGSARSICDNCSARGIFRPDAD